MAATVTLMQLLMLLARALRVSQRVSEMSGRRVQGGAKGRTAKQTAAHTPTTAAMNSSHAVECEQGDAERACNCRSRAGLSC